MGIVLGIESSCDESAAAVVTSDGNILSNIIFSQIQDHALYGGVVPEIAARAHVDKLDHAIQEAVMQAGINFSDIDAIAVTAGPGLMGGIIVGTTYAKTIASVMRKKFIAINHLEGHALMATLTEKTLIFPYLLLLISGGHSQFVCVLEPGKYKILGQTLDDAPGEAFDKVAKLLGLGYPGGPAVESASHHGNKSAYRLPIPLEKRRDADMSFSGLKTAVLQIVRANGFNNTEDLCASFQETVACALALKVSYAIEKFSEYSINKQFVVSGGVASNLCIRDKLSQAAAKHGFQTFFPPVKLCTDNAAMIAWAGIYKLQMKAHELDFKPRARWSLEEVCYET